MATSMMPPPCPLPGAEVEPGRLSTTALPTPIALPPPSATTRSTCFSSASARAASAASLGTCGATPSNSATSRGPSASRTARAAADDLRLGVHIKRMRSPSPSVSAPSRRIAPRPNRTRGGSIKLALLGERSALHHFEWVRFDLEQLTIGTLEIERVLDPIRTEVLDPAPIQLAANAL